MPLCETVSYIYLIHEFPIADVFKRFQDDEGNFDKALINDVEGLLSLYEASNYGVEGEEILDNALKFSTSHLRSLLHPQVNYFLKTIIFKNSKLTPITRINPNSAQVQVKFGLNFSSNQVN